MFSTPADLSLPFGIRALLSRSGKFDVSRLSDYEVAQAAQSWLSSAVPLRSVGDLEIAIAFFAQTPLANRRTLQRLLERAADVLDFATERDRGVVYPSQYAGYRNPEPSPDTRLVEQIRDGAQTKGSIASTQGGRWLQRLDLRFLVGGEAEETVWVRASERFAGSLEGDVKVILPYPQFDRALRQSQPHPLFNVPAITRIVFWLEKNTGNIAKVDPALFGAGVEKRVQGKLLLFRAG